MSAPSRFPNGITNVGKTSDMGMLGMPDPTQYHTYFNDFDHYISTDWVVTTTEAGAGSATEAISDADDGRLLLTNAAGDNDNDFLQWAGGSDTDALETFLFEAGKKLFFKTKFQVSDATESDVVVGLQITDTSPLAVSDGVYFLKADGSTTMNLLVTKNSTSTTTAAATMADATDVVLAFYYDGVSSIKIFADGVHVGTSVTTNLPDDEELTISFGIQNGAAAAKTMSIDYIFVAKER